jgi:hypothetical protein
MKDVNAGELSTSVLAAAAKVFDQCLTKIKHCLSQLSEEQVWWRPRPEMNSIGNLLLHLSGNVRQWIVSGLGTAGDDRDRAAEFLEQGPISKTELLEKLAGVVCEAKAVLAECTAEQMFDVRGIQEFEVTGWEAIFDSIPHFQGHTQEIICLTRLQLGEAYRVHWHPKPSAEDDSQ